MVDAARQMLDELMGRNRNLHPSEAGHKVNWEDPDFCQFYNVKFCPHDLFINTRADLGPCARIHDDEAKHLYEEARPSQRKRQYEDEFLRFCNVMLHDVDRKIQKGKQRLQLMQSDQPTAQVPTLMSKHQEQINILNARIKKLLAEAEEAGIRGDVDQAQDLMTICEELKEEKDTLQRQYENSATNATSAQRAITLPASGFDVSTPGTTVQESTPPTNNDSVKLSPSTSLTESNVNANANASANETNEQDDATSEDNDKKQATSWAQELNAVPEKQMKVCEICGAFLIVGDAQQRIEDHLMGKQHLGYSKLRTAVAEINERRQKEREDEERRRRDERSQRGNVYDHRRDQRDYRDRSRDYTGGNRHQSDKHRYHHKSNHRNSHSHNSRSRSSHHQHYHHQSRERSRSRSRY